MYDASGLPDDSNNTLTIRMFVSVNAILVRHRLIEQRHHLPIADFHVLAAHECRGEWLFGDVAVFTSRQIFASLRSRIFYYDHIASYRLSSVAVAVVCDSQRSPPHPFTHLPRALPSQEFS